MSAPRCPRTSLPARLAGIAAMERADLIETWRQTHGHPPPAKLSIAILRKALAYEAQCAALGGPKRRMLKRLAPDAVRSRAALAPGLPVGAELIRDWNGRSYRVTVTPDGFNLDGGTWRSLSAIARHITGAHWSEPRFFGLTTSRPVARGDAAQSRAIG